MPDQAESPPPASPDQLWTARQHPSELVLWELFPTHRPGEWVAVVAGDVHHGPISALSLEGYFIRRITPLPGPLNQMVIAEELPPEAIDTEARYEQYRHPLRPGRDDGGEEGQP